MRGVILLNIGTPAKCSKNAVEIFIGDMLSDPLVLDRYHLVSKFLARQVIAPLSASKSLGKYSLVWRKKEPAISPILYYMQEMGSKLEKQKNVPVEVAMRYGSPSIEQAFNALYERHPQLTEVVVFPLYPHYAQSSTQTSVEEVARVYNNNSYPFKLKIIGSFYNHPAFIEALTTHVKKYSTTDFDRLIFSYHSLPVHQVKKAWRKGKEFDYVYQLKETNQLLVKALEISPNKTTLFYSSQRGNNWLKPFLNTNIADLPKLGWKNIAIITPGFTVDNLETLYDVDIEARNLFMKAGGETFTFIPSLNAEDYWIDGIWKIISNS
ncbi:MAG: ferrochelatase [Dysgonamonadaceae bacterium]|nr:ferrochelatase [Dysgonamonadaceae bacterium]